MTQKEYREVIEKMRKDKKDNIQVVYGGRRFGTEGMVIKDYISKDKIREKIKELSKTQDFKVGLENYTIRILEELLEEN